MTSNISSTGRFSSQMLTYLGAQRIVQNINGSPANVFSYATGPVSYINAGSFLQSTLGNGVVGSYSSTIYNYVRCYFLSRGVGNTYADTMAAITIDVASIMGVTPQNLLEQSESFSKLMFSPDAFRFFNELRDPSHQIGKATTPSNSKSLLSREIRA